jgi:hypothetical protein
VKTTLRLFSPKLHNALAQLPYLPRVFVLVWTAVVFEHRAMECREECDGAGNLRL